MSPVERLLPQSLPTPKRARTTTAPPPSRHKAARANPDSRPNPSRQKLTLPPKQTPPCSLLYKKPTFLRPAARSALLFRRRRPTPPLRRRQNICCRFRPGLRVQIQIVRIRNL